MTTINVIEDIANSPWNSKKDKTYMHRIHTNVCMYVRTYMRTYIHINKHTNKQKVHQRDGIFYCAFVSSVKVKSCACLC